MTICARYHSFFSSASHRSNKFGNAPQTHLRIGYYADKKRDWETNLSSLVGVDGFERRSRRGDTLKAKRI